MRILIVSDVRVAQEDLHPVLEQQNSVDIISTVDVRHATDRSAQLNPDIVLFDAVSPESIGIVRELVASSPHSTVVAFTAGCMRDSAASGDMVAVLNQVLCGELQGSPQTTASPYHKPLSRRELQIAHLIENGLTNKAIGRQLGIEAATVKNHIHNICEKLKVHRRGEVAARTRAILRAWAGLPASQ